MVFYHGTSETIWKEIQKEGVLFGKPTILDREFKRLVPEYNISRCTYLTPDIKEASMYGNIILKVKYDPFKHPKENSYVKGCLQFRVYEPISIENVWNISTKDICHYTK